MKKIFLVLFAGLLMACAPLAPVSSSQASTISQSVLVISTSIPKDKLTPPPTWTNLLPASPTATLTASPVPVQPVVMPQPLPTGPVCLTLSAPADGITFRKRKPVKFIWYAQRGAQYYTLLLVHQDGFQEKIVVPGTELTLDRRAKPDDITYQWMVMAYDSSNQLICNSPVRTFTLFSEPVAAASATPSSRP